MPLIEINNTDQRLFIQEPTVNKREVEENKSIVVSSANFTKMIDAESDFDFTSFVKNVSRKNNALPKYIRDNWTIVVSIRNQLENDR